MEQVQSLIDTDVKNYHSTLGNVVSTTEFYRYEVKLLTVINKSLSYCHGHGRPHNMINIQICVSVFSSVIHEI